MIGGDGELGLLIIDGGVRFVMGLFYSLLRIECERAKLKVDLGVPMHHLLPLIKTNLKIGRCRSPFLCVEAEIQYTNKNGRDLLVDNAGTDQIRFDLVNILSIK